MSARRIRFPFANDEGNRSTIGVVVNCVAVSTNPCIDAKRPASLVWRIRQYGAYGNKLSDPSSSVNCATHCCDSVGNSWISLILSALLTGMSAPSQHATLLRKICSLLGSRLAANAPGGLRTTHMAHHQPPHPSLDICKNPHNESLEHCSAYDFASVDTRRVQAE